MSSGFGKKKSYIRESDSFSDSFSHLGDGNPTSFTSLPWIWRVIFLNAILVAIGNAFRAFICMLLFYPAFVPTWRGGLSSVPLMWWLTVLTILIHVVLGTSIPWVFLKAIKIRLAGWVMLLRLDLSKPTAVSLYSMLLLNQEYAINVTKEDCYV